MNQTIHLYRKRFIPNELISLHKDEVIYANEELILTRWDTLKPRADFSHGISAYFLKKNCYFVEKYVCCAILFRIEDAENSTFVNNQTKWTPAEE